MMAVRGALDAARKRYVKGGAADVLTLMSGTAVSQAVLLLGLPILTRVYEPSEFGAFAVAHTIGLILVVFLTFRSEAVLIYEREPFVALRFLKGLIVYSSLLVVALLAFALVLGRLADVALIGANMPYIVLLLALAFFFGGSMLLRSWLVRCKRNATVSLAYGSRGPVFLITATVAGLLGVQTTVPGGLVLLGAQVLAEATCFAIAAAALSPRERAYLWQVRTSRVVDAFARGHRAFSASFVSQIILQLSDRLPLLVVSAVFGPASAGLFSLAERVVAAPFQLVSTAVIDIFNRQASEEWNRNGRLDNVIRRWLRQLLLLSTAPFLIAVAIFYFFTDEIFGSQWAGAWLTLCLLSVWSFGYFNFRVFDRWFVPMQRYSYYFTAIGARLFLIVILSVLSFLDLIDYRGFVIAFVLISLATDVLVVLFGLRAGRGRPGASASRS